MAGSVEHMAVAVELLREDQRQQGSFLKLKDPIHFVLGNLAPDGIMSRKGYVRSMKMHTHFRDGIPDWEFTREDHQKVFHQRIRSFCVQMLSEHALDQDLYLGYVTHILTDEIFMKTIRQEFMEKIEDGMIVNREEAGKSTRLISDWAGSIRGSNVQRIVCAARIRAAFWRWWSRRGRQILTQQSRSWRRWRILMW